MPVHLSAEELLHFAAWIYPHVKFHVFNEAAIDSVHAALAAQLATSSQYFKRDLFNEVLESSIREFPDRVHRLRQRHGGTGYITMKNNP